MSFWDKLFRKKEIRHTFTDTDREISAELREQRAELRKIQQEMLILKEKEKLENAKAELRELKAELYGDDDTEEKEDNGIEDKLLMMFLGKVMGGQQQQTIPQPTQKLHIENEQLQQLKESIPKPYLKELKKLEDNQLKEIIKLKIGDIDDDTFIRAIALLRS